MNKNTRFLLASLISNIAFAIYYLVFGCISHSWWLLTLGTYYLILSIVRFAVLHANPEEHFARLFTGWSLILLSLPLVGTVILSVIRDRGHSYPLVVMLAIAVYSFTKITLAIIEFIKARKKHSPSLLALRNISLADAFVSIFALQRSMLVSFEGMSGTEIQIMNAVLGASVCVVCFLLGWMLLHKSPGRLFTVEAPSEGENPCSPSQADL